MNADNHSETKFNPRDAVLQFGQVGDSPVQPQTITFVVTGRTADTTRSYSVCSYSILPKPLQMLMCIAVGMFLNVILQSKMLYNVL